MCLVDEVGDSGVSVEVGDCRSAARALSRPVSVDVRSVRGCSSEYVDDTDGLRCTGADIRPIPRARSASSSDSSSLWAYASPPNSDSLSSEARPRKDEFTSSCVTTLMLSPGTVACFCDSLSGGPMGEVGVKGPDGSEGLEVSTGKGIEDGLLLSRDGGDAGDGEGEEDREGERVVGTEYGICGTASRH